MKLPRPTVISVAAAAVIGIVGVIAVQVVERSMKESVRASLGTIRDADVAGLSVWLSSREAAAEALARADSVRAAVSDMAARARAAGTTGGALRTAPEQAALAARLEAPMAASGFGEYAVVDRDGAVIAASSLALVGWRPPPVPAAEEAMRHVKAGETRISRPFLSRRPDDPERPAGRATMFVATPVRDGRGELVAVLALGVDPDRDFGRLLALASPGRSGETYAFDARRRLLSRSRFEAAPVGEDVPLTRAMSEAAAGRSGIDVDGYRNYRGVDVVGAWTWLDRHGIGVATEVDVDEAYRQLSTIRWAFGILLGLAVLASAGSFASAVAVGRLQKEVDQALRLGPYVLEDKLGEGGMGAVYRARHALLRRPTAVKLIRSPFASPEAIARFEREARLTSRLTHPNTIAVYDYGRSEDGVFYYAMELVEGIALDRLVRRRGPQPERRVLHILRQVAGSLAEAHAMGLVHRDVKPGNIMVSSRPETRDHVKVLDFGLVKELRAPADPEVTVAGEWVGTPLFMAPEVASGAEPLEARSDIYGVGAVAYFLLTGHAPIEAATYEEVLRRKLLEETPPPPSSLRGRGIHARLEALVMACLRPSADERPSARDLLAAVTELEAELGPWTAADALAVWEGRAAVAA